MAMSDFVCKDVPVFDVGKKQLEEWFASGALKKNPVYTAYPVYVGDYVIVHLSSSFGHIFTDGPIVWTGYMHLVDAIDKLPPVVSYPDEDPWLLSGVACEIEVLHVVDDAALYADMPVGCPVGGTCNLSGKCKAVLKDACPRYRASVLDSLAQSRAAGELEESVTIDDFRLDETEYDEVLEADVYGCLLNLLDGILNGLQKTTKYGAFYEVEVYEYGYEKSSRERFKGNVTFAALGYAAGAAYAYFVRYVGLRLLEHETGKILFAVKVLGAGSDE